MRIILWIIGLFLAWKYLLPRITDGSLAGLVSGNPSPTGGDQLPPGTETPSVQTSILDPIKQAAQNMTNNIKPVIEDAFGLSQRRRMELDIIAGNVARSMQGLGSDTKVFLQQMLLIRTDAEFQYLEKSFGVQKRKDLRGWIKKEIRITRKLLDQVNAQYKLNNMLTVL